jgi:hypothetical protein
MRKLKTSWVLLGLVAGLLWAQQAAAQFKVPANVAGSGGTASASSNHRITGTAGQPIIGATQNSSTMIRGGFWLMPRQIIFTRPPASWDFVANTGGNATIAVPAAIDPTIGTLPLQTGDAVGVFFMRDGSLICAGFSLWQVGRNMSITAWADDPQTAVKDGLAEGEIILYKIWDESERREYSAKVTYQTGGPAFTSNGVYVLSSLTGLVTMTHSLTLAPGWNMISSFVEPTTPELETLLADLVPNMVIMKNGLGQVFWPAFGINTIGNWNIRDGYQIFMQSATPFAISGIEILPEATPIPLNQGWNLVAYLRNSPMNIETALAGIADEIVIVKNNAGQVFWPQFGINTIGAMQPGEGYQMNLQQAATLIYPSNSTPGAASSLPRANLIARSEDAVSPRHYSIASNTGVNAILLVESTELAEGGEIAVQTAKGIMAGSGVIRNGKALIAVWGDNSLTKDLIEGPAEREPLSLKLWSMAEQKEKALAITALTDGLTGEALDNNLRYQTDAVWVANVSPAAAIPAAFSLEQNYPNPFNPSTLIKYGLPHDAHVELEVYNVLGQRVAVLLNEKQSAGYHEVFFHRTALPSGMYFYRLRAGSFVQTRKMLILR